MTYTITLPYQIGDAVYFPSLFGTAVSGGEIKAIVIDQWGVLLRIVTASGRTVTKRTDEVKTRPEDVILKEEK